MRTTLTLDDDVAALLERVRRERGAGLKETVNDALREGLRRLEQPRPERAPYRTRPTSLGRCLIGTLDNVADALAIAEGESFR
jgi:hypothetical protein